MEPTTETVEYPDLPSWAQPGRRAVIAFTGRCEYVTVEKITKARIIVIDRRGDRIQCERASRRHRDYADVVFDVRLGGQYASLASPDEPRVTAQFTRQRRTNAMTRLWGEIEQAKRDSVRSHIYRADDQDQRSLDERRLDALEAIEAAVAKARKVFEAE